MSPTSLPDPVAGLLDGLRPAGDQWIARCPTHEDRNPSLTVRLTDEGKLLVHCQAGCPPEPILTALGVEPARSRGEWTPHGDAVAVYDYRDEAGTLLFQVLRTADKKFPQRRPDPTARSGWRWSLGDTRRVLFRLPEVVAAIADGKRVAIAEGEKDALALVAHGVEATCNPGGAGKWRPEYAAIFRDASVTVCADKDAPGQAHARTVAASLREAGARVRIVEAADPHKDIAAHLSAGLPLSAVLTTYAPDVPVTPDLAPDVLDLLAEDEPEYEWLVEGLLEREERLVLTGTEGLGKTQWCRMMATCLASGIHPTRFSPTPPLRVLYIDCENSKRLTRRKLRPMIEQAERMGRPHAHGNFRMILKPGRMELESVDGAAWLLERVTAHRPDVLFIGPLYKLHRESGNDEVVVSRILDVIDDVRAKAGCAVILEAHAGHATAEGSTRRSVRPRGSSALLGWPEFGYGLRVPDDERDKRVPVYVEVVPWRGERDEREWPTLLRRSETGWPWEPADEEMRRVAG